MLSLNELMINDSMTLVMRQAITGVFQKMRGLSDGWYLENLEFAPIKDSCKQPLN